MLVLTRKVGEKIQIGDDIVVTVLEVKGDAIKLGFDAPRGIKIQRSEVLAAVAEANRQAAVGGDEDVTEHLKSLFPPSNK